MNEILTVDEIAKILFCSKSKAYKIIRSLNQKLIDEGTPRECVVSGRISKKYFCETLKISI